MTDTDDTVTVRRLQAWTPFAVTLHEGPDRRLTVAEIEGPTDGDPYSTLVEGDVWDLAAEDDGWMEHLDASLEAITWAGKAAQALQFFLDVAADYPGWEDRGLDLADAVYEHIEALGLAPAPEAVDQ